MQDVLVATTPHSLAEVVEPSPEALVETLLQLYEDSGFGDIMPISELRSGFADLLADVAVLFAELNRAQHRGVRLAAAVRDPDAYPHLSRVHGYFADAPHMQVPSEFAVWMRRVVAFDRRDPSRCRQISHIIWAMASHSHPSNRLLGRFAVFELLCVGVRFENQMSWPPHRGPRPFEGETPADFIEGLAENELEKFDASPEYLQQLRCLLDPSTVPAAAMKILFETHHSDLAESLAFVTSQTHEHYERRQRFVQLMTSLPPDEALLFRRKYAHAFGEAQPTFAQLRRLHPGLLGHVSEAALRQRTRRQRVEWERQLKLDTNDLLVPWQGETLASVLASIVEEEE